ncbi:hypothetical protein L484_015707 [Morus notabilis]|uniref:Uncharacterized protein n=1 Tax=Morus notabilis TaxID=981085 RepID=W9SPL9_9ROSA|nr:hypothetical protein L484_015707 [Morus notabilis]
MALTRILFPLALLSLLVVITSAIQNPNNVDNPQQQLLDHGLDHQQDDNDLLGSTPNNLGVDKLLGNLLDNKQDQNENSKPQGQANFIPKDPSDEEKTKPYEGQEHVVPTKPYYGQEQKTYDQAHGAGIYSDINHIAIQGFVLCESEANKFYPLKGAVVEITCPYSHELNGYNKTPLILHPETDEKGCFREIFPELTSYNYINLKECKAFPKYSPSETCNVPAYSATNGLHLSLLRTEEDKAYYTVGNLIYTPNTHYSTPNKYYPVSNDHSVQNGY